MQRNIFPHTNSHFEMYKILRIHLPFIIHIFYFHFLFEIDISFEVAPVHLSNIYYFRISNTYCIQSAFRNRAKIKMSFLTFASEKFFQRKNKKKITFFPHYYSNV